MSDITLILAEAEAGDHTAAERLLPLVYRELRQLAASRLKQEKPGQTLQATALVHEAYLRLVGSDLPQMFNGRAHFFTAAAEAMRRILVENARRKQSDKHGGDLRRRPWASADVAEAAPSMDVLALHEAIDQLEASYPRAATVVKLRYFAGMSFDEVAQALDVSKSTAEKEFAFARAWLELQMSDDASE
jgi:RNA polymerase sigma factor (TIGR02999 family)